MQALQGRVTVELPDAVPWETVRGRIGSVMGVANFSRVHATAPDFDSLKAAALDEVRGREAHRPLWLLGSILRGPLVARGAVRPALKDARAVR